MAPDSKNQVKRARLTLKQKFDLIQDHKNKVKVEDLAKKYDCGKTAVYEALKIKDKIIDDYMSAPNTDVKKKTSPLKYEKVDQLTIDWLNQV